jgi:DNA-binding GntR family transcriptional regulator
VEAAGNGVITGLYRSITFQQERVAMTAVRIGPGRRKVILLEHEQLAAALAVHDEAAAIAVLGRHLGPVQDILAQLPVRQ